MGNIHIQINEEEQIRKYSDVPTLVNKSNIIINNQEDYELAAKIIKEVKSRLKELEEERKKITKPLDDGKKAVMDLFRKPLELLETAERKLKAAMNKYVTEMERKAREEEERLRKLAEAEAEKERKRLEAQIKKAEEKGKVDKVEELKAKQEEIIPITPVIMPQVENPKGVSYREKWYAEVIDFKLLPDEYKLPNQQALDKVAQATKGSLQIPGVIFKSEKITVIK